MSVRVISAILATALLSGCGLAGTGAATAVNGATAAEEAKSAQKQLDKVQTDLDAAQKKSAETRAAVDADL